MLATHYELWNMAGSGWSGAWNGVYATSRWLVFSMSDYMVNGAMARKERGTSLHFKIELCKVNVHCLFEVFIFTSKRVTDLIANR